MIRLDNVDKWFGSAHVLRGVSLDVAAGSIVVLCGESGAGKSTLLATVNGLEPIQGGTIHVDGTPLPTGGRALRRLRRNIGVVFQGYNLFDHLTAQQNILLGLEKVLGLDKRQAIERALLYLERVGLEDKRDAYPVALSGGQQQRVAIARCLAMQPKVLLLDEPTSALDLDNSREVVDAIRDLRRDGLTIVLATHQIALFAEVADEFACMRDGRVTERGAFSELRRQPPNGSQVAGWLRRGPVGVARELALAV